MTSRFRDAIPHVRTLTLPGVAHEELMFRNQDRLLDEIRAFLLEPAVARNASGGR